MVNDFYLTMSLKVFNNLHTRFQILDHIPMRLLRKFKKCHLGKTANVDLYDTMLTARLRLPLTELHQFLRLVRQLDHPKCVEDLYWGRSDIGPIEWGQLSPHI